MSARTLKTGARTLLLLALAAGAPQRPLAGQEVEPKFENACGGGGCDGVCSFSSWPLYYERLERLQEVQQGTNFDTFFLEGLRPDDSRIGTMRETWYTRKDPHATEAGQLYHCVNAARGDSRISASTTEGAPAYNCFRSDGQPDLLANPWLGSATASRTPLGSSTSALSSLRRYVRTGGTDYRTGTSQAPAGYTLDALYEGASTPARLGYERFGNLGQRNLIVGPDGQAGYGANLLDNGTMRVDFNRVWGNAIGRITLLGTGRQIVSESIGDMVQSVLRFGAGDPDCRIPNPTQSGGAMCAAPNYSRTELWAGSPIVKTVKSGPGAVPQSLTTVVRPLEFCHNGLNGLPGGGTSPAWRGVDKTRPLAWNGFIERTDALTCKLGSQPRKDVLRSSTRIVLGQNNAGPARQDFAGLNTYWLKPRDLGLNRTETEWDFDVWCEDLDDATLSRWLIRSVRGNSIVNGSDSTCGAPPGSTDSVPRHRHAIVATRKDGTFGYALARLRVQPGDTTNLTFRCALAPCSFQDKGVLVIQANHPFNGVAKSAWSETNESFLILNTKAALLTRLGELRSEANAGGVDCVN